MDKVYDKALNISLKDEKKCDLVYKALSNRTRRDILRLLSKKGPLSVQSIAFNLDLPLSTTSEHLSILLKSQLVDYFKKNDGKGITKIIYRQYDKAIFSLNDYEKEDFENDVLLLQIPIGSYNNFEINELCGIICEDGYIGKRDDKISFYEPERFKAQLIWFDYGYLEYKIPINKILNQKIIQLSFSLELCSEAPGYNENWKSDIYFEVNNVFIGEYTSNGDYGKRNGKLNPKWRGNDSTKYGILKNILINEYGSFIDGSKISNININDLNINNKILIFKLGIKEDARNRGGLNLFGERFGDYPQNINILITYQKNK